MTPRQLATVLAALRLWQRVPDEFIGVELLDIAMDGGNHLPMSGHEIDRLCEELNLGPACHAPAGEDE